MDEREIKLRLVEAAAQLPLVRATMDEKKVGNMTHAIVDVWYNNIVNGNSRKAQPKPAPGKSGSSMKK